MKRLKQIFLKPGAYRVGERMLTYTAEDLRTIAANTKKLLASGIAVPLWAAHKMAGSPEGGPQQFSNAPATDNKGWMADVRQLPDGSLEQTLEVLDDEAAKGIDSGSIRFTSPEIGDYIDGLGRDFGTVIRHMALTPTPRNPQQGPFQPVVQFSLSDRIEEEPMPPVRTAAEAMQFAEDEEKKDYDDTVEAEVVETDNEPGGGDSLPEAPETPAENPDMPSGDTSGKEAALLAHMKELGVTLPADWSYEGGFETLYTAVIASNEAKKQAEADAAANEVSDELEPLQEEQPPMAAQFSEADKAIRKENAALKSRLDAAERKQLRDQIDRANISPGIKQKLHGKLNAVQFSESGSAKPQFSMPEVVAMLGGTLPKGFQFSEDGMIQESHPDGDKFMVGNGSPKSMAEAKAKNEEIKKALRTG